MYETFTNILTANWLYSVFAIIAVVSTVVIIFVILSENRNPVKSLGWVTVLLLLPVVGLILYIFFGRSIKKHAHGIQAHKAQTASRRTARECRPSLTRT